MQHTYEIPLVSIAAIFKGLDIKLSLTKQQIRDGQKLQERWAAAEALVSKYGNRQAFKDYKALAQRAMKFPTPENFQAVTTAQGKEKLQEVYDQNRRIAKGARRALWEAEVAPFLLPIYQLACDKIEERLADLEAADLELRQKFGFCVQSDEGAFGGPGAENFPPAPIIVAIRDACSSLQREVGVFKRAAYNDGGGSPSSYLKLIFIEVTL